MTRAELDELETLYIERSDSLDASSYSIPELIALAREALELREALEYSASEDVFLYEDDDGEYCCAVRIAGQLNDFDNFYGSTPLEAINNARRGK